MTPPRRLQWSLTGESARATCCECSWADGRSQYGAVQDAENHVIAFGHDVVVTNVAIRHVTLIPEPAP